MPPLELLLIACLLAIVLGMWLRVDALQHQVRRLQAQMTEHVRQDLGVAPVVSSIIVPPARTAPDGVMTRRPAPALRLVKR
ncbi:MAG: hypothetical protein IT340_04990 [Chloroflexi bacterium]|nr:hypothetical protein [Chloroflexota bacterium]